MRKLYTILLALSTTSVLAQTASISQVNHVQPEGASVPSFMVNQKQGSPKADDFRKNIIKVNVSSLLLNNYSLSYERSLSRKITFVGGYRFMPKSNVGSLPLAEKIIDRFLDEDDDIVEKLKTSEAKNKAYTGEVRFYTGKKPGARGFYLSVYGRYMQLDATYTHDYGTDSRDYAIPLDGNIKGFGGGLMLGSQWLIANRITFDWYILGAHYGSMKADLSGTTDLSSMSADEKRGLEEDIESINDSLGKKSKIDATVTNQGVTVKGDAPFAGIRGLGFNLGIAF